MKMNLQDSREYLEALELAENFGALFKHCTNHPEDEILMDQAMGKIERWCPHLWPLIDRVVFNTLTK